MTATSKSGAARLWYLDSSVALRILLAHSEGAVTWYDERAEAGDAFVSSRLLHLETVRVLRRESVDTTLADDFVSELSLLSVDDRLIAEAAAIRPHVKSLDALHLASALRLGAGAVTIVTHDANMTRVADDLGFDVFDPVG
ncbi:type II toxin-antitoxin system VapC family toxin [Microbacterium sp.]|uniref:type II toxin-antitoxin system VapC family toxin n=1 Tax=Microbacterium sp. TaxID=51671 RepID=UPI003C76B976